MEWKAGESDAGAAGENRVEKPSDRARWIAAVSYVAFLCVLSLWRAGRDPFIRYHASQGLLLFIAECCALALAAILGVTVGRITIVGLVIVGLFELVTALAALTLSAVGFVKALFGEYWSMPFLGEYRSRVPGFHWQEGQI